MERMAADRRYGELHADRPFHNGDFTRWSKEPSAAYPYHFSDGVTIDVNEVDLSPDDDFLTPPPIMGDRSVDPNQP